jgi:hypothetical protein
MTRNAWIGAIVALLACLTGASAGAGTTIFKVRLKDGSIVFTDQPPPGSTILQTRASEPPPVPVAAPKPDASTLDAQWRQRQAALARKDAEVEAAERAVAEARARLEKGREPQAGDFIGTARKGIVRHSPAYEERVRALEQAVTDAEARLAQAKAARDAVR